MSTSTSNQLFRRTFTFPTSSANWFPGHMNRGLQSIQRVLKKADCIIEVHDARIPFSGRNLNFQWLSGITTKGGDQSQQSRIPHILVLNKCDLINRDDVDLIKKWIEVRNNHRKSNQSFVSNVLFTNALNGRGLHQIQKSAVKLIQESDRFNRQLRPDSNILVVGIPNVGKSSIINYLRNTQLKIRGIATPVGDRPGVTRSVMTKIRISDDPLVYLIDTPGVMTPNIQNMHAAMKLILCATIDNKVVPSEYVADYLLYLLNLQSKFEYASKLNITSGPTDNIQTLLTQMSEIFNLKKRVWDYDEECFMDKNNLVSAASKFIRNFREGEFGKINLDQLDIEHQLYSISSQTKKIKTIDLSVNTKNKVHVS